MRRSSLILPSRRLFLAGSAAGLIAAPGIVRAGSMKLLGAGAPTVAGGAFTGAGDLVSGALAWWGLRAYTLASIGNNCITITRASDSTSQTFVTVAGGGVDLASIATFLAATSGKIVKYFDQTGNGNDVVAVAGSSPTFTASVLGSLPAATFAGTENLASLSSIGASAQPFSVSSVFRCTLGNAGADQGVTGQTSISWTAGISAVSTARTFAGSGVTAAATDNVFHAMQNVFNNTLSHLYVDGSDTSGTAGTQGLAAANVLMGQSNFGKMAGSICEVGIWNGHAFSGTEMSNLNSNQHTYWGF
jgi:hypothetical protein